MDEKALVRWSRTNWGRAEEIGIVGDTRVGISAIGHFHRTRGGDGWPRTGDQVKQTEGGREGVQMAERKVAGRSRGRQSFGIGWRLFSASTSISICFQRRNEFVFSFVLARSSTRACGSRFAMERTGIGSSRITGNYSIL